MTILDLFHFQKKVSVRKISDQNLKTSIISKTIKVDSGFFQFQVKFSLFKLIRSFCEHLKTRLLQFIFWKESNKCGLCFLLKSIFFAMLDRISFPPISFCKSIALCTLRNSCRLLTKKLSINGYFKSS